MKYNGYLIDLDGTIYIGDERIDAAADFIQHLDRTGIPYLFVTNNSSNTPEFVAKKLTAMDIPATPRHVFTSSTATAKYIRNQQPNARCFMIGEEGLETALAEEGAKLTDQECDFVIAGIDHAISYEKYAKAFHAVRNGAVFLSTNGDITIPSESGLLPGNGALTSVITVSTGVEPTIIGKPGNIIMEEALKILGTPKAETLMIGDNYHTDIQAGMQAGMDTLLVFTGVTTYDELESLPTKPTYHVHGLDEWTTQMKHIF